MFQHIIGNHNLVMNPQNTWKHHITRLAKTDTKLTILLSKLHDLNKGALSPSCTWFKCTKASSWWSKGSLSSILTETCTTSSINTSFNAFALDLMMSSFGMCNASLVFVGRSTSSLLSLKEFDSNQNLCFSWRAWHHMVKLPPLIKGEF
jgi:hypothetical protein